MFYLLMKDIADRNRFIEHMRDNNIITPFHYIPLHSSPAGRRFGRSIDGLPVTNDTSDRLVRLPLFYGLTDEKFDFIVSTAREFLDQGS